MKIENEELEECTFMDEELYGLTCTYDPETEELMPSTHAIITDDETLLLKRMDNRIKNLEEKLDKIEKILEWNID